MLDHALIVPAYFDISWELTRINDYSKINAMFGIQNNKYKNWETSTDAYTAEAVSYTHLDVYKRQTSCNAAKFSSPVRTFTTRSTLYTKILPSPI